MKVKHLLLIVLYGILTFNSCSETNNIKVLPSLCGPYCLYEICNKFYKLQINVESLCLEMNYNEHNGTSLLDLFHTSKILGLPATPLKLTLEQLCDLKSPAIVHVDDNHFLIFWKETIWNKVIRLSS